MNKIIRGIKEQEPISQLRMQISRECYVTLELLGVVTQEAIEKLIQLLKLMQDTYELQEAENLPF